MLTQAATERSFNPGAMINIPFGRNMPMSLALSVPRHGDYSSSFSPAQFQYENGSELTPAVRKKADQAECDHMHQQDLFHCRMVGLPEWEANPAAQLLKHVGSLYWASTFLRFRSRSAVTPGYPPARTFRQFTQTGNSDTMWCRITREV
jgi:hypothetical protein